MTTPPDPKPDPTPAPAPAQSGLTETELEALVSRVVDARIKPMDDRIAALDLSALRTGVLEDLQGLFAKNPPAGSTVDEAGLLAKVSGLLDEKLSRIPGAPKAKRTPGPLGRWLTGS